MLTIVRAREAANAKSPHIGDGGVRRHLQLHAIAGAGLGRQVVGERGVELEADLHPAPCSRLGHGFGRHDHRARAAVWAHCAWDWPWAM